MSKLYPLLALAFLLVGLAQPAAAVDLPLASGSNLAGISFDDQPLSLPVQRNFQMAMLTAGSELGRSCGKMEAYGWRMNQSEQGRVDQIFNNAVEQLHSLGYDVETQTPNSISHDITMFTADRPTRHLLAMWSAGEIGLVMVLCETSAPPVAHAKRAPVAAWPSVQTFPQDVVQSKLDTAVHPASRKASAAQFSPLGTWVGSYVCTQGYTGATLTITRLTGENFSGEFHFYPTAKNPSVPEGRYAVYGQYDRESQRILINPGRWIQRPRDYYDTVIVGSFDPLEQNLSAYFQGINGCTSFEARLDKNAPVVATKAPRKPKKHKKKVAKKTAVVTPVTTEAIAPVAVAPVPAPQLAVPPAQQAEPLAVGAPTAGAVAK